MKKLKALGNEGMKEDIQSQMPSKTRIKVLHVIKSLGRGGAEVLLVETLKSHDLDRFEFHYIYFLPWKDQMVKAIEAGGGKVICMKSRNNLSILLKWRRVAAYIQTYQIDIVHSHLPWAGFVSRLVFLSGNSPLIYTEHNKQERYHRATKWLNRLSFGWQSLVVAVSQEVRDSIVANIKSNVPVKVVSNGLDIHSFVRDHQVGSSMRQQYQIPDDSIVVGIVSVFRTQKRLKEWVDVFCESLKKYPNLFGVMVGDGPLKDEVVAYVLSQGLAKKILFPGLQIDIKPWYSMIDIFLMTSKFEGLPIALLEAMSMECAVVSTRAGGIAEVIRDGVDGFVEAVDNWNKLPQHVVTLALNEEKRSLMARNARMRVVESFDMKSMVKSLEAEYVAALEK